MPTPSSEKIFHPPVAVQKACRKGLALKDKHGGKGLREETLGWAEHFAAKKPNDAHQAKRMRAWFHRHQVDRKEGWDNPPTPGYVAWQLWGGDAGLAWVEKVMTHVEAGEQKPAAKKTAARAAKKSPQKAGAARAKKATKKPGSSRPAAAKKAKKKVTRNKKVAN